MTTRSILFCDVDGVLNDTKFRSEADARIPQGYIIAASQFDHAEHIDPDRIARINAICERTGCEIVLSSAWRLDCVVGYEKTKRCLAERGLKTPIIDMTPDHRFKVWGRSSCRYEEINSWLDANPTAKHCVLDDMMDADPEDGSFVHVPDGIEDEHVERVVEILR